MIEAITFDPGKRTCRALWFGLNLVLPRRPMASGRWSRMPLTGGARSIRTANVWEASRPLIWQAVS
jgi:hypothetical protein